MILRAIFFTLMCLMLANLLISQDQYGDYQNGLKEIIFHDDFTSQQFSWSDPYNAEFSEGESLNGFYRLTSMNENAQLRFRTIHLDHSRDFEIEARIRFRDGDPHSLNSLIWEYLPSNTNTKFFGFTGKQEYRISFLHDGTLFVNKDWTSLEVLSPDNYNTLTVRKVSQTVYFFINEKYVFAMPYNPGNSHCIGFQAGAYTTIDVDYMTISYLKSRHFFEAKEATTDFSDEQPPDPASGEANTEMGLAEHPSDHEITGEPATIKTGTLHETHLVLADYTIREDRSAEPDNQIGKNEITNVQLVIENIGQSNAERVRVNLLNNQAGIVSLGVLSGEKFEKKIPVLRIPAGESRTLIFKYFIGSRFNAEHISFRVDIEENGTTVLDKPIGFRINQTAN